MGQNSTGPFGGPAEQVLDYEEQHVDGEGVYTHCNVAEDHAFLNLGHSVSVIRDRDDAGEPILRVWCLGTPEAYINGVRNCVYFEEVRITT